MSAASEAAAAKASKMAAVNKVVSMLENLKSQVLSVGELEAKTYSTFACFCKDTTAEKTAAINRGIDEKASLSAAIAKISQERDEADATIEVLLGELEAAGKAKKNAREQRQAELTLYVKNEADLSGAIEALEGAIKTMKASKVPSMLQFRSVSKTVRAATMLADALGLGGEGTHKLAALLQEPGVPMQDYKFHSDRIIKTLEGLLNDFRAEKADVDAEEVKAVAAYDAEMQKQSDMITQKSVELDDTKKLKAQKHEDIAASSDQRTTVAATLLDDQEYLKGLAKMCADKAKTWDQRSKVRQDELSALVSAMSILRATVAGKTTAATMRLVQQGVSARLAEAAALSPAAMEAMEADAEAADGFGNGRPPSFLQRAAIDAAPADGREAVWALLRSRGEALHSTLLTSLASRIHDEGQRKDPLAKVKTLIQELIERLLREASNDVNQKEWCDKALSDAKQRRDYVAEQVTRLNSEMSEFEALRDTLKAELDVLFAEMHDLKDRRAEAEKIRVAEKAENARTIADAEAGHSAVTQAATILDKFYKTIAKESVDISFSQRVPADDTPDAGFKNGEAYTGSQGDATGILGMLDVIRSDFERTISETEDAEAQAQRDHLVFMTDTGKSLATKTEAHHEKSRHVDSAVDKLSSADEELHTHVGLLAAALKELQELKPVCITTGMTYAERVERREEEIKALKKGLCILEHYVEYGPGTEADVC